jgi:hypothetical protein
VGQRAAHRRVVLDEQHEGHEWQYAGMAPWRTPAVVLAWLAATGLGAGVVWVGLRPVLDTAVPDRTVALSAADLRHLATPSAPPVPTPSLPPASPSHAAPSTGASPHRSSPSSPAAVPSPSSSTVDGWTVTVARDGTPTYLRTFQVPGGTAVIRMVPGTVSLVSATPNADYTVRTTQNQPSRLVVQFLRSGTSDIVDAIWWNDAPFAQVSHT